MLHGKKYIMRNLFKFRIVDNKSGELTLRAKVSPQLFNELKAYNGYLENSINMLDGISESKLDYDRGNIFIKYSTDVVGEETIMNWINKIIDITVDNYELISENTGSGLDEVMEELQQKLKKEISYI